jgi:competence protein ComEA
MTRRGFVARVVGVAVVAAATLVGHAQAQGTQSGKPTSTQAPAVKPIDLNKATTDQLATLPGIGPAVAARIVEYRQKNGDFKKIEELMNVRGIGEKSFLKLKALVTVGPPKVVAR